MSTSPAQPNRTELDGAWTVRAVSGPVPTEIADRLDAGVPATVPGVVHTDLLDEGLIPDPYDGDNESAVAWIGECDWEYSRTFEWSGDGHRRHDLVADGLDTVATVWLNDVEVGRSANHHRSYRFDVADVLREGRNEIRVVFTSAVAYAAEKAEKLGPRPHSYDHPFNAIRKPAYSFGWDWGPTLVTAGIWQSIVVESWSTARIASVRPLTSYDPGQGAALDARVDVEYEDPTATLNVAVEVGDDDAAYAGEHAAVAGGTTAMHICVPGARPWWPRGHGDQPLYSVRVTLTDDADGGLVGTWTGRVGFRTVDLDTSPDQHGSGFSLKVNQRPVYVRGVNWIPDDTFLPRITRESLDATLAHAVAANINLVRVWGGGIYESEDFYDLCDEQGLLVWQDFPLACAAYSEEEPLASEFEAEARQAVTRMSTHPSLAIWNGGNENLWGYASWGWRAELQGATWGDHYYTEVFPRIVAELAPGTPYCAGSPYSVDPYLHPNDEANGTAHIWDVWNSVDYSVYRDHRPRFVSEFGFQGPPAFSTLESVVHDEPRSAFGPQMLAHQKAGDGNRKLERGLGDHLPMPASYIDWHWATQLNQARAIRFGIEHVRSLAPFNTGAIVWQLNDCWPVVSWSAVDGLGKRKPLWYALRSAFADRLATIQPRAGAPALALVMHNNTDAPWSTTAHAHRMTVDGTVLASADMTVEVAARGSLELACDPDVVTPGNLRSEFVVIDLGTGERALWYFVEDTELGLRDGGVDVVAVRAEGGRHVVELRASTLVKDLTLLVDHVDPSASVDQGLVTLLPGETVSFVVTGAADSDPSAFAAKPVLRTSNDLVAEANPA